MNDIRKLRWKRKRVREIYNSKTPITTIKYKYDLLNTFVSRKLKCMPWFINGYFCGLFNDALCSSSYTNAVEYWDCWRMNGKRWWIGVVQVLCRNWCGSTEENKPKRVQIGRLVFRSIFDTGTCEVRNRSAVNYPFDWLSCESTTHIVRGWLDDAKCYPSTRQGAKEPRFVGSWNLYHQYISDA
jgi:hypothetical protein